MDKYYLIFLVSLLTFFSCEKKEDNPNFNYYVILLQECLEPNLTDNTFCVSKEEYERIKEISIANEEGDNDSCLRITLTDLDGNLLEGIFRGYGSGVTDCN